MCKSIGTCGIQVCAVSLYAHVHLGYLGKILQVQVLLVLSVLYVHINTPTLVELCAIYENST